MAHLVAQFCVTEGLDHFHFHIESADFMKTYLNMKIWWQEKILEPTFAFVYLDGEHNVDPVVKELQWFIPKMVDNGIISIDDTEHIINSNNEFLEGIIKTSHMDEGINRLYYQVKHGN